MGLTLDYFETAWPGVKDADEGEIVSVGGEDAPVEWELLPIAATEGVRQERKADPVARGKDDDVDRLTAAIGEDHVLAFQTGHVRSHRERLRGRGLARCSV